MGRTRVTALSMLFLAALVVLPGSASAATLTVNTTSDSPSAQCTLRDAIAAANANGNTGGCSATGYGADVINFSVTGAIQLTAAAGGELPIGSDIQIHGPGAGSLEIKGDTGFRVFNVTGGSSSISGLTVSHGDPSPEPAPVSGYTAAVGGGIRNSATLALNRVTVTGNTAGFSGSGGGQVFAEGAGGGIANVGGTLSLNRTSVTSNHALADATNTTIAGVPIGMGGGIANGVDPYGYDSGTLTIDRSHIDDNTASGTATCCNDSAAEVEGGGLSSNDGVVTVKSSTFRGNEAGATSSGGSLENTALALGAGIANRTYGELSIDGSLVDFNKALASASGASANSAAVGGGMGQNSAGTFTITRTTLTQNEAGSTTSARTYGGGLSSNGHLAVTSATITSNSAANGANIYQTGPPEVNVFRNTIVADPFGSDSCSAGTPNSGGYNLEDANSCNFNRSTDRVNQNPKLASGLADNGGPTQTIALMLGSPAIDQGKSFGESSDQRGRARPFDYPNLANAPGGTGADIGAYERQGTCRGRPVTIVARRGHVTEGTRHADVIAGTPGPDTIRGRGGDDVICGWFGADRLIGGAGNDRLWGGPGSDTLRGGPGRDHLRGGAGRDECRGEAGRDSLAGCET